MFNKQFSLKEEVLFLLEDLRKMVLHELANDLSKDSDPHSIAFLQQALGTKRNIQKFEPGYQGFYQEKSSVDLVKFFDQKYTPKRILDHLTSALKTNKKELLTPMKTWFKNNASKLKAFDQSGLPTKEALTFLLTKFGVFTAPKLSDEKNSND